MSKRYNSVFSDEDKDSVNNQKVSLKLIYGRICIESKSYILVIEK
jgi:hypothetical protein